MFSCSITNCHGLSRHDGFPDKPVTCARRPWDHSMCTGLLKIEEFIIFLDAFETGLRGPATDH